MPTQDQNQAQTLVFTFRPNGENAGQRMTEITAEPVEQHEAPALADRQSWFGPEEKVADTMGRLAFAQHDVDGVLAALYTNRVAARNVSASSTQLEAAGFHPSA